MVYRECHSLQLPILVGMHCLLDFSVAMLEELGQNGNDILLQIVGCSIIKYFAQFVGFVISPNGVIPDRREPYRRVPLGRVHLDERRLDEVQ